MERHGWPIGIGRGGGRATQWVAPTVFDMGEMYEMIEDGILQV